MSNGQLQVIQNVSANLRQARQQQGWSQERLASEAGISRRMLVNIEAGESNVSIATVDRLANALGLAFAEVVRPPQAGRQQANAPLRIWQGNHPDSHATLLHSLPQPGLTVELWQWQLAQEDCYVAEPDPAGSHEMLYVFEGELTVEVQGKLHQLGSGQSLSFATDTDYVYRNSGAGMLRFTKTMIMAVPAVGA